MKVKYNRLSSLSQSGNRLTDDKTQYDLVLLDRVSGSVSFKERPKGHELTKVVEQGKISELWVEEFSRLGRNTGDVINTLDFLTRKESSSLGSILEDHVDHQREFSASEKNGLSFGGVCLKLTVSAPSYLRKGSG